MAHLPGRRPKKGHGGEKKYGRAARSPSHLRYNAERRCFKNKLRRVLKTQGEAAAEKYREEHR